VLEQPFPHDHLLIWKNLGLLSRAFCVVLLLTSVYCLYSAARAMLRLNSLRSLSPANPQTALESVRDSMTNMRRVIDATFYVFGIVLFSNLQTIGDVVVNSKTPLSYYILHNFLFQCFLAQKVFVVFLALHTIQWYLTRRVNSYSGTSLNDQSA